MVTSNNMSGLEQTLYCSVQSSAVDKKNNRK